MRALQGKRRIREYFIELITQKNPPESPFRKGGKPFRHFFAPALDFHQDGIQFFEDIVNMFDPDRQPNEIGCQSASQLFLWRNL
jgi:hypothetical protein